MNGFRASKKYLWPVNFPNSPTIDKCGEKLILDAVCNTKHVSNNGYRHAQGLKTCHETCANVLLCEKTEKNYKSKRY